MKIAAITDEAFRKYGKVVSHVDLTDLLSALEETPVTEGVVYEPGIESLEQTKAGKALQEVYYGEMPIQIGFCNGHNHLLNAVEYHRDSEINVAATDAILLLGQVQDIEADFTYDTAKMEAFLLPAGTAVELYATTLHYAPCSVDGQGFRVAIVLPKGTNYPLEKKHRLPADAGVLNEDVLLTHTNKWLIGHPEGGLDANAFIGLKGKNLDVTE